MTKIKHAILSLGLLGAAVAGLLISNPAPASAGTQDTLTEILAKLDAVLQAVEASSVDLSGVTPNWDRVLPAQTRFASVLGGAAYRDNTTGLVWEARPVTATYVWTSARWECVNHVTGGVKGWRLPSVHELGSLLDPTRSSPALPAGHPFQDLVVTYNGYWTSSTDTMGPNVAWAVSILSGYIGLGDKSYASHIWCVRGPSDATHY